MLKRHSLATIPFDEAHRLYDTDVDVALFDDDDSDTAEEGGGHSDAIDVLTDDDDGTNAGLGRLDSTREEDASSATVTIDQPPPHSHVMNSYYHFAKFTLTL
jgi:hypothetical protein